MARLRFCFGLVVFNGLVVAASLSAATAARAQEAAQPASCQGMVCDLAPGSGAAPITSAEAQAMQAAEDARARKVAADFDNQKPDAETAGPRHKHRHAATTTPRHGAKVATSDHAVRGPLHSGLSSYEGSRRIGAPVERPIATIFGLAPAGADPYGRGLQPWLDRLAWPQASERPHGSVAFAVDGIRDPSVVATDPSDTAPITAAEAERLSLERRATALSIQGFDTLKADLPRS